MRKTVKVNKICLMFCEWLRWSAEDDRETKIRAKRRNKEYESEEKSERGVYKP